jgi:hypothetical protein
MSRLTDLDKIFLEDPERMKMGKGKLSKRYGVTEDEIVDSRAKVQRILSASEFITELDSSDYKGSIKDAAKTLSKNSVGNTLDFKIDIVQRQFESKLKESETKYKNILNAYEELNNKYNDALRLSEFEAVNIIPLSDEGTRQGASIAMFSDWHVEKVIAKKAVNGFNEFNPEIARKRAYKCADNLVKLINRDSNDFDSHSTVLYLSGDFIEGYIHPEAQQVTNSMTPIEASAFALELLTDAIKHIQENADTNELTVVCRTGNHSRTSKRMESSLDHRTNYETMIYAFLAQKFKGDIQFNLPESDIGYTEVLGKVIRDFHGWQCSYGGGIGGLTVPLTKFIHRQNQNKRADYNLMGHFHQSSLPTKDCMMNGSLCGFDSYAQSIGATKEPALQSYRLLDSKYGFTGFNPIICE